jgi:hypothetical protein
MIGTASIRRRKIFAEQNVWPDTNGVGLIRVITDRCLFSLTSGPEEFPRRLQGLS